MKNECIECLYSTELPCGKLMCDLGEDMWKKEKCESFIYDDWDEDLDW